MSCALRLVPFVCAGDLDAIDGIDIALFVGEIVPERKVPRERCAVDCVLLPDGRTAGGRMPFVREYIPVFLVAMRRRRIGIASKL